MAFVISVPIPIPFPIPIPMPRFTNGLIEGPNRRSLILSFVRIIYIPRTDTAAKYFCQNRKKFSQRKKIIINF